MSSMIRHTCSRSAVQAPYTWTSLARREGRRRGRQAGGGGGRRWSEEGVEEEAGSGKGSVSGEQEEAISTCHSLPPQQPARRSLPGTQLKAGRAGPGPPLGLHLSEENLEASSISRSMAAYMPSLQGWSGPNSGSFLTATRRPRHVAS